MFRPLMRSAGLVAFAWFALWPSPSRATDPPAPTPPMRSPDRFTIELAPPASRAAFARRGASATRLGLEAADRVLASIPGAWIEPTFRGDKPPEREGDPDFASFYVVHVPYGSNLDAALERFRGMPGVRSAYPIPICPVTEVPNDSLWSLAYYFDQPSGPDIGAVAAWDLTHGDTNAVVAVLDTGVLPYHPDLQPLWTNGAEAGGSRGADDDRNGYIDDVHGWDFVSLGDAAFATPGEDWRNEDADPNDFVAHGTLVSGLIGAINNNGIGITGTAWNVRIMPLRVGWSAPWQQSGVIDIGYLARAIRYATRMKVDVINLSVSNTYTPDMQLAVRAALDSGITMVVAAGNNGSDNSIAGYAAGSAVFVAATDANDELAPWSSRGSFVDLSAPGTALATTVLLRTGTDSLGIRQPGYVAGASGTSFSAPLVSGAVALLQGGRRTIGLPLLDRRQVRTLLRSTTDDMSLPNPVATGYGTGRLNMERFVRNGLRTHAVRMPRLTSGSGLGYSLGGRQVLAYPSGNSGLWRIDAASLAHIGVTVFPGRSVGGIGAADVAPGVLGLFVGGESFVAGFDGSGNPLPGWPVTMGTTAVTTPALGDLDGGGVPEVVVLGASGDLLAWRANGTPMPGFPIRLGPSNSLRAAPALTDLDDRPGVEILVAATDGTVHAFGSTGAELPGWPVMTGAAPAAPVVTRRRDGEIVVVVATSSATWWLGSDGRVLATVPRAVSSPAADPALGDLDGDGEDEVVVTSRDETWAFHLDGSVLPGWPATAGAQAPGAPLIGRVDSGLRSVVLKTDSSYVARDRRGRLVPDFPPYPIQTPYPMFVANGVDRSRLVVGSDNDVTFFAFDCPAPVDTQLAWPTLRGNAARTGSRLYSPVLTTDPVPPGRITDLRVETRGLGAVALLWTAPGDDGDSGRLPSYDIRSLQQPITDSNFATGVVIVPVVPAEPGSQDSIRIAGLVEGTTNYFALRGRDEWNQGPLSNVVATTIPVVTPSAVTDLRITATTDSIVHLAWTATGDNGRVGRPREYVVRGATISITPSNFDATPYARTVAATVDAGGRETLAFGGLLPNIRYWFAVKARDADGYTSGVSNVVDEFTIDVIPPAAIADLRAQARGPGTLSLLWTAPGDDGMDGRASTYDLRWLGEPITESNFRFGTEIALGQPAPSGLLDSVKVSGLTEGNTYYFAVRARDELGTGPLSNVASLRLPVLSPAAVRDLRAVLGTETSATLAWTATGDDGLAGRPLRYEVRAALAPLDDAGFETAPYRRTAPASVDPGVTETFMAAALEPDRRYWFALKAYDADGYASPISNTTVVITPSLAPAPVSDLRVMAATDSSVTLAWTATGDNGTFGRARRYVIRAASGPVTETTFDAAPLAGTVVATVEAGATETAVFFLARNGRYWLALRAYDGDDNPSFISNVMPFTMPAVPPATVSDLRATAATDTSVTLAWTASGDDGMVGRAHRYTVVASAKPLATGDFDVTPELRTVLATVDAGGTESMVFDALARGRRFWFAVVAYDTGDHGSPLSNIIDVSTLIGGPIGDGEGLALALGGNPARGQATFYWRAAPEAVGSPHRLHIFDLSGRRVRSLDLGSSLGGKATWDGRDDQGSWVGSGVYVMRLSSGSRRVQVRVVLLP